MVAAHRVGARLAGVLLANPVPAGAELPRRAARPAAGRRAGAAGRARRHRQGRHAGAAGALPHRAAAARAWPPTRRWCWPTRPSPPRSPSPWPPAEASRLRASSRRHAAAERVVSEPARRRDRLGVSGDRGSGRRRRRPGRRRPRRRAAGAPAATAGPGDHRRPRAARARTPRPGWPRSAPPRAWSPGSAPTPPRGQLRAELAAAGVRCALRGRRRRRPPAAWSSLVDAAGQRTMLADRGAAARLAPAGPRRRRPRRRRAPAPVRLRAARPVLPARPGSPRSPPPGPPASPPRSTRRRPRCSPTRPTSSPTSPASTCCCPARRELAALTGSAAPAVRRALLAGRGGRRDRGRRWIDLGRPAPDRQVPAEPAPVVDSTGAGDAFDAGLLAAWLDRRRPRRTSLRAGAAAGARAVTRLGARPGRSVTSTPPMAGARCTCAGSCCPTARSATSTPSTGG